MSIKGFTRRTHLVRVKQPIAAVPAGQDQAYIDLEVLDAIAYQTTNGHVHVWKCPSLLSSPYILDKTGDEPDWSMGGKASTRGSHAQKVLLLPDDATTNVFDIEVLDRIAFRDDNGKVWCLNHPSVDAEPYCVTDGTGDPSSTRRTHLEVINGSSISGGTGGVGASWTPPSRGTPAMVVERVDMISFKGADEKTLIIKMESHDDGSGARANTYCTPQGYDPELQFGGVDVPDLDTSGDPNFYFKFLNGASVYTPPQPIFSLSGWGWQGTISGGPNDGQTYQSVPIFNNAAQAQADYELLVSSGHSFILPGSESTYFSPSIQIGTTPGGFGLAPSPAPVSGGIGGGPGGSTIKISMGPLWWVRAVYLGGGTAGDEG